MEDSRIIKLENTEEYYLISEEIFQDLLKGEIVLDRKTISILKLDSLKMSLVKYPFLKPLVRINLKGKPLFQKLSSTFYYIDAPVYFPAAEFGRFRMIKHKELFTSKSDAIEAGKTMLLDEYKTRVLGKNIVPKYTLIKE